MNKKIKLIVMTIFTLVILTGCKSESPSDVVENYFDELKKGENAKISEEFINSLSQENNKEAEQSKNMYEAINIYMSKLDAKSLSEKIEKDNASVEVELTGLNLGKIMLDVMQENLNNMFNIDANDSANIDKAFLEKTKSADVETRTGIINLTKVDGKWKINEDNDSTSLIFGNLE